VKKLVLIILVVCLYTYQDAQPLLPGERDILQLQDQCSLGGGKLIEYLKNENGLLRYRAAIALANVQDTSAAGALGVTLKDGDKNVRTASALALGQLRSSRAADELLSSLALEKDPEVIARILEALGKISSSKYLDSLLRMNDEEPLKFPQKGFALCIARFAIRQIKSERAIRKCYEYAGSKAPEISSAALFALWRSAPNSFSDQEISQQKELLGSLALHQNSDIRMQLATLLGKSKTKEARELLDALEISEKKLNDWHVWVQIVRARAAVSTPREIPSKYSEYLSQKNDHIKIAALQALSTIPSLSSEQSAVHDALQSAVLRIANGPSEIDAVRGEALVTLGKHFPGKLDEFYSIAAGSLFSPELKAKLLEGLSQIKSKEHLAILRQHLTHESIRVSMAAWDFIRPLLSPAAMKSMGYDSIELRGVTEEIFKVAQKVLAKNDMGITTIVANLFTDTVMVHQLKDAGVADQAVDEFIRAFGNLTQIDDGEAKQAILQALGSMGNERVIPFLEKELSDSDRSLSAEAAASLRQLTGKDYSGRLVQQTIAGKTEADWNMLESIKPRPHVRFVTNRGDFIIELFKDHAPWTVLNFVRSVKTGFYNGLKFHRVVPDFVVQGGDPRGDGWGGPGYKMRTEISTVNYERGTCGMASAGKDTEGSQFFITHISTPHLDGRYTIFAKVVKGMDVVDLLQIGDTMKTVQLTEE